MTPITTLSRGSPLALTLPAAAPWVAPARPFPAVTAQRKVVASLRVEAIDLTRGLLFLR